MTIVNLSYVVQGMTCAIDVYCWLHKGAFGCAEQLVQVLKIKGGMEQWSLKFYSNLFLFVGLTLLGTILNLY